jgi:hypothetical protein
MSIAEVSAERFARLFHHYYEALAPDFPDSSGSHRAAWSEVPAGERGRVVTAIRLAIRELGAAQEEKEMGLEGFYAKPGEAEWGC